MKVLVIGGSGTVGFALLHGLGRDCEVIALSRTAPPVPLPHGVRWRAADIADAHSIQQALQGEPIEVLIYAAFTFTETSASKPLCVAAARRLAHRVRNQGVWEDAQLIRAAQLTYSLDIAQSNLRLFRNVIDAVRDDRAPLQHVILVTGAKTYGVQWGPTFGSSWQMPLTEDAPRHPGPNWYFDLEDYGAALTLSGLPVTVLRPGFVLDELGLGRLNLAHSLCVYLGLLRQCGVPAIFPGGSGNYQSRWSMTPSALLGRIASWIIHCPETWGLAFNVAAHDAPSWANLWPVLASLYGLAVEVPEQPLSIGASMRADARSIALLRHMGYNPAGATPIDFIDQAMVCDWDQVLSMRKAQQWGFDATADLIRPFIVEKERLGKLIDSAAGRPCARPSRGEGIFETGASGPIASRRDRVQSP